MKLRASEWLVYAVALISATVAVFFVYGYVQNQVEQAKSQAEVKTVTIIEKPELLSVVVANRDIFRGEKLEVDDLKVLNVPTDGVLVKGVTTNPQDVVGHVAQQKIYAGEWILTQKIGTEKVKVKQSIGAILEKQRRAMRLPVSAHSGLLGILNPGDHVDIISVFESADSKKMISRVILQNIQVLSIGQSNRMTTSDFDLLNQEKKSNRMTLEQQQDTSMLAVDVDVKQAEQLALAMNVGALHVALRNPSDTKIVETQGVNLKVMEKGKGRPPKYKPKQKREVIEILQGGVVQEVIAR